MRHRRNRAGAATLACALLAVAASLQAGDGGTSSTPAGRKASVDAVFAAYDRTDSPGCSLGVFQNGRIEYARGYGMANLELGSASSPQTVYDIGSTAKQFTAFAILLLGRDGKLSVDDDIRKFLPELPDYGSRITIRHLLTHTSGLRDYLELMDLAGVREEDLTTEQDALDVIVRQKATNFPPGKEHLYSNSGYFLLSLVVRRASGKSLREFARDRIFEPLGMTHTQYNDDHARIIPGRAIGYAPRQGGGFAISMSDFEQTGDGGLQTTVEDLLRWDGNFYEPAVGDRSLLSEMQKPGRLNDGKPLSYAFGLAVGKQRGLDTVSHGGAWVGYRAQLLRFPGEHFSVACLCNLSTSNPSRLARQVAAIYLAERMEKEAVPKPIEAGKPAALTESEAAGLAGAYREPASGAVAFLSAEGGKLAMELQGERQELKPVSPGRFLAREGAVSVRLTPAPAGRPRLEILEEGEPARVFEPLEVWAPTAAQLADFAGAYRSEEVAGAFRFAVADGKLVLQHRTIAADPWKPTLRDAFTLGPLSAAFRRDAGGRIVGFELDAGRVRGIAYRKLPE